MPARFNNDIAIGVADRKRTAAEFCQHFGATIERETEEYVAVKAGPYNFYFVEDGTRDIAFSVNVDDGEATLARLRSSGFEVDAEISTRVGEPFVRNPDGILINLFPVAKS